MQSQENQNPYFLIFEKRRLKVQQIHRARREQLFNKSRKMFQLDVNENENQQKSILETAQKQTLDKNISQYEGESSINIQNNQDNFFQIEQNQIKEGLQAISISKEDQKIQRKQSHEMSIQGQITKTKSKTRRYKSTNKYAKIIQIPSWMNTVPEEPTNFYCMARPNGRTGLLVFDSNWMKIYDKFGRYINIQKISQKKIYENQIKKVSKLFEGTTLQITYSQEKKKIYIIDVLFWKYSVLTAENFQFRYAWLMANLGPLINSNTGLNISLVQYLPLSTPQNLKKIYCQDFGYQKQGLLFIQKQSPYIHGYNQNVMIWKDSHTSKYPMDQQKKQSTVNEPNKNYIYGSGKLVKNRNVYTLDGYKLGHIGYNSMPGQTNGYIRFRITGITLNNTSSKSSDMQMTEQKLQNKNQNGLNLSFVNFQVVQFKKFGKAEPLSRIMFQYRIRYDPLTIQEIASRIIK